MAAVTQAVEAAPAAFAVANRLSPSQVATFSDCPARWYYKHALGLPDPRTGNMALGIAVHEALAYNFEQKILSKRDLPPGNVAEQFEIELKAALHDAELRDEENPAELRSAGRALVLKYMSEAAPDVLPAAVEVDLLGIIGGVLVAGVVDLVETSGRIRDFKTRQTKRSAISGGEAFQLATYVELLRQAGSVQALPCPSGAVQVDSLIRTKTPQLVSLSYNVDRTDLVAIEKQYPLAQDAMRSGYYMPNRSSNLCSRKNCAFWRTCEGEYGGRVA